MAAWLADSLELIVAEIHQREAEGRLAARLLFGDRCALADGPDHPFKELGHSRISLTIRLWDGPDTGVLARMHNDPCTGQHRLGSLLGALTVVTVGDDLFILRKQNPLISLFGHRVAQWLVQIPRRWIADAQPAAEFDRGDALLGAAHQVHGAKPGG
jgi:hypothetical protein